jgi:hypothetical protein
LKQWFGIPGFGWFSLFMNSDSAVLILMHKVLRHKGNIPPKSLPANLRQINKRFCNLKDDLSKPPYKKAIFY